MLPITLALATITCFPVAGEPPSLFRDKSFSSLTLAQAVNHYISLGEQDAIKEIKALASASRSDLEREYRTSERIGWVCRILYQPKGRQPLREPMYGALNLPNHTMPLERWPLFPVASSGSTYFVLSEGYHLAGLAEDPEDYLDYCHKEGRFRKEPITLPSREQALKDVTRLRDSPAWKAIKWKDYDESVTWDFIKGQAEAIPAK